MVFGRCDICDSWLEGGGLSTAEDMQKQLHSQGFDMSVEETEEMMNEMVGMGILEKVIDERRIREEEKRRDLEEWGSEMTDEFNVVFEKLKLSRIDAAVITYGVSMALFRGILRDAKPGSKEEKE